MLEVHQFAYGSDNYGFLVHDAASGETACIDAGDANAVFVALDEKGWSLTQAWITHHHWDHTDGLMEVKEKTGCKVFGPHPVSKKIDGLDETLGDGDQFSFGGNVVDILHTPGHTTDMINFYIASENMVFTGDTLFVMGCGRLFEGDAQMMWQSLNKLMQLPENTIVYCAHEYTLANADFALTIEPENQALINRRQQIADLRAKGLPTVPTTLKQELETNPFLRASSPEIRQVLSMPTESDAAVFKEIRLRKDRG